MIISILKTNDASFLPGFCENAFSKRFLFSKGFPSFPLEDDTVIPFPIAGGSEGKQKGNGREKNETKNRLEKKASVHKK